MSVRSYLSIVIFFASFCLQGQTDIRRLYDMENPVPAASSLSQKERILLHERYVEKAAADRDTLREFVGTLHLYYDYHNYGEYSVGSEVLLRAESLAEASDNDRWRGWVSYRRGNLNIKLRRTGKAIDAYKKAADQCKHAGDSLCLAESLEQVGTAYALGSEYSLAQEYFDQALPMLERHGKKRHVAKSFSNYGGYLNQQKRHSEALPYLEKAVRLFAEVGDDLVWAKSKNNLAMVTLRVGRAKEALQMFEECITFNKERGYVHNIMRNYSGLKETYRVLDDYKTAYSYFRKYITLRDSLIGSETKLEIAELESKYNTAQQKLALEKSERALVTAQKDSERKGIILLFILILVLLAASLWWRQNKRAQIKIEENKKNLNVMTSLLARKNEAMLKLQEEVEAVTEDPNGKVIDDDTTNDEPEAEQPINLFAQPILTSTDWTNFKVYFENTYPGYVRRLRSTFSGITEAEERLFLLLKLNLTNKEISHILGISSSSVKKTRNRLRKRLKLVPEDSLEEFIRGF